MTPYPFQRKLIDSLSGLPRCALYLDMGLGKTFISTEIAKRNNNAIVVICQKSKINDWVNHLKSETDKHVIGFTSAVSDEKQIFSSFSSDDAIVVNYDLVWRRNGFKKLRGYTLILDESSLIQNDKAKRTSYIMSMSPDNVILCSGTPVGGKYENLWSQINMLGWKLSKKAYMTNYVVWHMERYPGHPQFMVIEGYQNIDRLKRKLSEYGAVFMKAEEAVDLPETVENTIYTAYPYHYAEMLKDGYTIVNGKIELTASLPITKLLRCRQICSSYNPYKATALEDALMSTSDNVIVFHNFSEEALAIGEICQKLNRPYSFVNGDTKDISALDKDSGVLIIQYQAGAMGLNLQSANRVIYYSPTCSGELFMQSKARVHRIGQKRTCFYTYLVALGTIEEDIYKTLEKREDYTLELFKKRYDKTLDK